MYPQDLCWPIVQCMYRKPDQEALILFYGCDAVAWWIHSKFSVPKVLDLPHTTNISDYRIREGVLDLLHGHCRAGQKQTTRWNYDPEETHHQLCDAQGIRHRHCCSILGCVSGHACLLWPGPALPGLCLLILLQLLFFPLIRLTK